MLDILLFNLCVLKFLLQLGQLQRELRILLDFVSMIAGLSGGRLDGVMEFLYLNY